MLFFAGDAEASAEAEADFLVVELALFFFEVAVECVVVPVDVVIEASSFFCVWQPRKAVNVSAVIKDKTDVFIVLVKLNEGRECRSAPRRASIKILSFFPSKR